MANKKDEILEEAVENEEAVVEETVEEAPADKADDDAETEEPVPEPQPTAEAPATVEVETDRIEKVDDTYVRQSETKVNAEGSVHFGALTPVYTTSVEVRPARYIQGPVYIVDGKVVTGRVRVSANADGRNILGWVNVEAIQCK